MNRPRNLKPGTAGLGNVSSSGNRPTHYNRRVRLIEMVEEVFITQEKALLMCLHWMAQDDIDNMMEYNELKEIADGDLPL